MILLNTYNIKAFHGVTEWNSTIR